MGSYIPLFILFIIVFVLLRQKRLAVVKKIIKNRKKGDKTEMIELAKEHGLVLLGTKMRMYEACGKLYTNGLVGNGESDE